MEQQGFESVVSSGINGQKQLCDKKTPYLSHVVPDSLIHSILKTSPTYTQSPVSSLGSSKERAQGVTAEESPTTRSTKGSCIQLTPSF